MPMLNYGVMLELKYSKDQLAFINQCDKLPNFKQCYIKVVCEDHTPFQLKSEVENKALNFVNKHFKTNFSNVAPGDFVKTENLDNIKIIKEFSFVIY